jgi:hypothetical protein
MSEYLLSNLKQYRDLLPEKDKAPDALVFPLTSSAHEQGWRRLCKRAGIKDLHFHDLKHTAITNFGGKPIELNAREMAYMADHSLGTMTSKYEHIEMINDIREKLNFAVSDLYNEVAAHDLRKINKGAEKQIKESEKKLDKEKIAVFQIKGDGKILAPLGYYTKHNAYELLGVGWRQVENLVGFEAGRYVLKYDDGKKFIILDPGKVNIESVLQDMLGNQAAAQGMLEGLDELTSMAMSYFANPSETTPTGIVASR